ncbi:MAG TPA: hypothetical protein VJ850_08490 [Candidatus Limnocylindrales bacterium]|nr:hypothetical protein [Candidatus Limnocylindrales bacterium]
MTYEDAVNELIRPRLHAVNARFDPTLSSNGVFMYRYRHWLIRIELHRSGEAVILDAHVRRTGGLRMMLLFGRGWQRLLGPASVGEGRMYRTTRAFLVRLYEEFQSRRDVQRELVRSNTWPSAA